MRRLLIDHARDRVAAKRGCNWERVELTAALARPGREVFDVDQLITLNDFVGRVRCPRRSASTTSSNFIKSAKPDVLVLLGDAG